MIKHFLKVFRWRRLNPLGQKNLSYQSMWQRFHIDPIMILLIMILFGFGLTILFSSANRQLPIVMNQLLHFSAAMALLLIVAQIPPDVWRQWSYYLYFIGVGLLFVVLIVGRIGNGGQRWLDLGLFHFQPSEILKLALPVAVARYLSSGKIPLTLSSVFIAGVSIVIPFLLVAKQPDLGTALVIGISGISVLLFAGLSWQMISIFCSCFILLLPFLLRHLHTYQIMRIATFLNQGHDPLGKSYHIIQSKIALGSGGIFGKGFLNGTQSHLQFLPEHTTDFIYAVCGEEFGLIGCVFLVLLYLLIALRCFQTAVKGQDTFARLIGSSLGLTFFVSAFINMGMVTGMLPVVGIPLPLVSYGGTSMLTMMAAFGMMMSMHTHRRLYGR